MNIMNGHIKIMKIIDQIDQMKIMIMIRYELGKIKGSLPAN